jgi:hypothetical protein
MDAMTDNHNFYCKVMPGVVRGTIVILTATAKERKLIYAGPLKNSPDPPAGCTVLLSQEDAESFSFWKKSFN